MRHPERAQIYLRQYRRVPAFVRQPFGSGLGEQVLGHLLDRNAMEFSPELSGDLQSADADLAEALAEADPAWWEQLDRWAAQCGLVSSLWWMSVRYSAQRRRGGPVSLADSLRAMADSWVRFSSHGGDTIDAPDAVGVVFRSFRDALVIGVAEQAAYLPARRGPGRRLLTPDLRRLAEVSLAVVVPGSLEIGMQLPRRTPGEPASGPAEGSLEASDLVMTAGSRYDPTTDAGVLSDLIGDARRRDDLWRYLGRIYRGGGVHADAVEVRSAVAAGERQFTWEITKKPQRRPRPRPRRIVLLEGEVRAVDLDRRYLRLRVADSPRATEVTVPESIFLPIEQLGLHLGSTIPVRGYTRDQTDVPREVEALDFPDSGT